MYLKEKLAIYVSEGVELEATSQGQMALRRDGERSLVPVAKVGCLLVEGDVQLRENVLRLCRKNNIELSLLSRKGSFLGHVGLGAARNVHVRVLQFKAHVDGAKKLSFARAMVFAKVRNSMFLVGEEDGSLARIRSAGSLDELRGFEGVAAKKYFGAFGLRIKSDDFSWVGRSKRPPLDGANALLSFGYTMLYADLIQLLELCGLDPYLGFLHDNYFGRASLACDFLEEFRSPIVDRWVLGCINRGEFCKEDFEVKKLLGKTVGVFLNKEGKRKFFPKWLRWYRIDELQSNRFGIKASRRRLAEKQIRHFIQVLCGDEVEYKPFDASNP